LIRAAELLRAACGEAAIVGRIASHLFSICSTAMTEGGAETFLQQFESDLENLAIRVGSATYSQERPGGLPELLEEAYSRLAPKTAMLAH